jgi:hypothetical protein
MTLEVAGAGDVEAIVALVESAFRGEASRAGWTTEADLLDGRRTGPDEISAVLAHPAQRILLERDPAGGLGKRVVTGAEQWVRQNWQASRMRMTVIAQREELIAWYERRGYRRTGETAPFFYGDERFGLPKRDDLSFVVLEKPLAATAGD